MKHEIHQALKAVKRLIASGKDYNITAIAKKHGVARESLSRALKREGVTK